MNEKRHWKLLIAVILIITACSILLLSTKNLAAADSNKKTSEKKVKYNRLINQSSPYLLQHATNPVDWYPWGKEAFEKAKKENKPTFLSIGYSTCHWCHVMEQSFGKPEGLLRFARNDF